MMKGQEIRREVKYEGIIGVMNQERQGERRRPRCRSPVRFRKQVRDNVATILRDSDWPTKRPELLR